MIRAFLILLAVLGMTRALASATEDEASNTAGRPHHEQYAHFETLREKEGGKPYRATLRPVRLG